MADIRLICCDIDGTLVRNDKSLSSENIKWVRRVNEELGIPFAIVTGRMNISIRKYFRLLGMRGPSSCLNGCMLYDEDDNPLCDRRLDKSISNEILSIVRRFDADMLSIEGNTWFTERKAGYLYENKLHIYGVDSILCSFDSVFGEKEMNKLLVMSKDKDMLAEMEQEIACHFGYPGIVTLYPGPDFLEIMPGNIDKGTGIKDLSSLYGIDYSQIMAIGDDLNDIKMLALAGVPVAMGNAADELKEVASYVTSSNEDDGVAEVLKQFFYKSV